MSERTKQSSVTFLLHAWSAKGSDFRGIGYLFYSAGGTPHFLWMKQSFILPLNRGVYTKNCEKMGEKKKCSACGSGNVYRRGKRLADEELVCRACGYVGPVEKENPAEKEGEKHG